jgi:hypothetical protein
MPEKKSDYTPAEIRAMLTWELAEKSDGSNRACAHIVAACETVTDEVLIMWERAGLTASIDLQERVVKFRQATA